MTKNCRVCGEELNESNTYKPETQQIYGNICRKCKNLQDKQRYDLQLKKPPSVCMRGKYRNSLIIEFKGFHARNEFLLIRRLQTKSSGIRTGYTSRANQRVEYVEESEDATTGDIIREYKITQCDECGGIVRYDDYGDKVCEDCGLLHGFVASEFELYPIINSYNVSQKDYYKRAHRP